MSGAPQRTPHWWDACDELCHRPVGAPDPLSQATDRLALAWTVHRMMGGHSAIAATLEDWCLELKKPQRDRTAISAVLHGLDRLNRHDCEPQTWQHLTAAEIAIAAYLNSGARGGVGP